jgi:hypothetical protein
MNIATILGLVRHILTFGGGFLVTNGAIASSDLEVAVGAITTLVGIIWSALSKNDNFPSIK